MSDIIDALYDAQPEDEQPAEQVETTASAPEEKVERIGPLEVFSGVLLRPAQMFERLRHARLGHWWIVFIIAAIGVILAAVGSAIASQEAFQAAMEANAQPGQDIGAAGSFVLIGGIVGGVVAVIGLLLGYAIRTGTAYGLGLAFGGKADFRPMFRMAIWSALPEAFGALIAGIAVIVTGQNPAPGLSAALTATEAADMPVLAALLGQIDLFTLWSAVLLAIGVAVTARLSQAQGAVVSLIYYALVIAFSVGAAAAGAAFTSGFTG